MSLDSERCRPQWSLRALFALVSLVALFAGMREWRRERVRHPETGFYFPETSDIESMRLTSHDPATGAKLTRQVPSQYWAELIESLSPSELDSDPAKWGIIGELQITPTDGEPICVGLADSASELEEFTAVGKAWSSRTYFRGGNANRLQALMNIIQRSR